MINNTITVGVSIEAGIEKVWKYYTEPRHIVQWNFATDTWCCPSAINDLRVGGKYIARMEAKDGSFGFDFEAVYDVVVDQKQITYTMADQRRATIVFEPNNHRTEVSILFDAEDQNPIELQRSGWQAILNNFKKYTEAN